MCGCPGCDGAPPVVDGGYAQTAPCVGSANPDNAYRSVKASTRAKSTAAGSFKLFVFFIAANLHVQVQWRYQAGQRWNSMWSCSVLPTAP